MKTGKKHRISDLIRWVVFAAWMSFWFWAFTFSYSDDFFQYSSHVTIIFVLLALLSVAVPPVSGYVLRNRLVSGTFSVRKSISLHLFITTLPLIVFMLVFALFTLLGKKLRFFVIEADESMGIGIDFICCMAVVVAGNIVFAVMALLTRLSKGPP